MTLRKQVDRLAMAVFGHYPVWEAVKNGGCVSDSLTMINQKNIHALDTDLTHNNAKIDLINTKLDLLLAHLDLEMVEPERSPSLIIRKINPLDSVTVNE